MDIKNIRYGDQTDADLMLRLLYWNGSEYTGNPIHIHSRLLSEKSEYFKTVLSGRWSKAQDHPNNILDFTIDSGNTPDEYIRCIKFLYALENHTHFLLSGVSETLKILQVASEWLIGEVAEACMEYLEAIPWSDEEALQIKNLISSLQIQVSPDMSARLSACQSKYLEIMEIELKQMLSSLCAMLGNTESLQTTCYKLLATNCGEPCSKQLKSLTKSLVLQEAWNMLAKLQGMDPSKRIEGAKIFLWFISTLRSMEVREYVSVLGDAVGVYKECTTSNTKIEFLNILDDAFKKIASGKMVLQRKDRLKLVTKWSPIIQSLPTDLNLYFTINSKCELRTSVQQGFESVISTLPAEDYILISKSLNRGQRDLYSTPVYSQWIENLRRGCNR